MGSAWANARAPGNLQLEESFDHWRPGPLAVLFSNPQRQHQEPAGHRVSPASPAHIPGKILVLWDGAPIHRSLLVKSYIASTGGRVLVERLPAYAPELNPVEYMWGHLKTHEIANLLVKQAWELSFEATAASVACVVAPPLSPPATYSPNFGLNVTLLGESQ